MTKFILAFIIVSGVISAQGIEKLPCNERFDIVYQERVGVEQDTLYIGIIYDKQENQKYLMTVISDRNGIGVGLCPLETKK